MRESRQPFKKRFPFQFGITILTSMIKVHSKLPANPGLYKYLTSISRLNRIETYYATMKMCDNRHNCDCASVLNYYCGVGSRPCPIRYSSWSFHYSNCDHYIHDGDERRQAEQNTDCKRLHQEPVLKSSISFAPRSLLKLVFLSTLKTEMFLA